MTVAGGGCVRVVVATAPQPGAVALVQLHGTGSTDVARTLTGGRELAVGRLHLRDFAGIDVGLVAALRDDWVQLMPHGGPRVVRKLVDRLIELSCVIDAEPDPCEVYTEASSPIEADVLATIARAASPAAIDILAAQPERWRAILSNDEIGDILQNVQMDRGPVTERSRVLDRLIDPPSVVVVGRPNVGKSTLTNAMLGRAVSIVADLPGTTRDWVAGLAELGEAERAVAVRWMDTPGLRDSDDPIEQRAIELARQVVASADVLISMRDPQIDWPEPVALPRDPDLWVVNKIDEPAYAMGDGTSRGTPLAISAADDRGLDKLQELVLIGLRLHRLHEAGLWAFSPVLRAWARGGSVDLGAYVGLQR